MNFTEDHNTEEPHLESSSSLSKLLKDFKHLDMKKIKYPDDGQYVWVKTFRVYAGCWDSFFLCQNVLVIE